MNPIPTHVCDFCAHRLEPPLPKIKLCLLWFRPHIKPCSSPQPTIIHIITLSLWVGMHPVGTPPLGIDCLSSCRLAEARQTLLQDICHTAAYLVRLAYDATFLTSCSQVDISGVFMPTEHVILAISCCKKVRFLYCLLV